MLDVLRGFMWFGISLKLRLPVDDCERVIIDAFLRVGNGTAKPDDFNKEVLECVEFFINNVNYLYPELKK